MMLLHFYLLVNVHTQETHEGVLHEAFDHGATVEALENHETVQEHNNTGEHQDVYNYDAEMHNDLHELVHDGSNFIIEDHVEDHPAWNFMEDNNKAVEENTAYPHNPPVTQAAMGSGSSTSSPQFARATSPTSMARPPQQFTNSFRTPSSNSSMSNGQQRQFINPRPNASNNNFNSSFTTGTNLNNLSNRSRPTNIFQPTTQNVSPTAGGLGCTTDPAKATMMANQLIGMLFRSSQMMSEIVNMFNVPNPRSTVNTRPTTGSTFQTNPFSTGMTNTFATRPAVAAATSQAPTTGNNLNYGNNPSAYSR